MITPIVNLIVGTACPTLEQLERVQFVVGQSWWKHQHVVTTDDHGINAEVARQCMLQNVSCTIVGTSVRPKNGAPGIYVRVIVEKGIARAEMKARRDAFALALADRVITLGVEVQTEKWKLDLQEPTLLQASSVE